MTLRLRRCIYGHLLGWEKKKKREREGGEREGGDEKTRKRENEKNYLTLLSQQKQLLRQILHPTSCGAGTKLQRTERHPERRRLGDRAPGYSEEQSRYVETNGALLMKALNRLR